MNMLMYESLSPYAPALLCCECMYVCVRLCVWLAGLINRQWVGRWKESTASDYWHNSGRTQRPALQENLAGGGSALQSDPLHPTYSAEKTHRDRLRGTQLYLFLLLALRLFFFSSLCVTISFRGFLYSNLPSCQSLCLLLSGTLSLTLPRSQDGMLRVVKATCRP